jgi:hypothetical protein
MWTYVKKTDRMWDNEYKFGNNDNMDDEGNSQNSNTEDATKLE